MPQLDGKLAHQLTVRLTRLSPASRRPQRRAPVPHFSSPQTSSEAPTSAASITQPSQPAPRRQATQPWLSDSIRSAFVRLTRAIRLTLRRRRQPGRSPPAPTAPDTTITSGPIEPTTSTSASFAFTSTPSGATFQGKLDSGSYGACTSPKATPGCSRTTHTFSVRATAAGLTDQSPATRTWTISPSQIPRRPRSRSTDRSTATHIWLAAS